MKTFIINKGLKNATDLDLVCCFHPIWLAQPIANSQTIQDIGASLKRRLAVAVQMATTTLEYDEAD